LPHLIENIFQTNNNTGFHAVNAFENENNKNKVERNCF
jgi:hypothetical protein